MVLLVLLRVEGDSWEGEERAHEPCIFCCWILFGGIAFDRGGMCFFSELGGYTLAHLRMQRRQN